MENVIYLNGNLVSQSQARVSVLERGFLYGDGLFETMRSYKGRVFKLEEHLRRLFRSSRVISLKISQTEAMLKKAIYATLKANRLKEAYLRLSVSRGEGLGLDFKMHAKY